MIIATSIGLFGPYGRCQQLADRVRTWPADAAPDAGGADLPFSVVGTVQLLDIAAPAGFCADDYAWDGSALAPRAAPDPA